MVPTETPEATAWRQRLGDAQPIIDLLVQTLPRKQVLTGLRALPPFGPWPTR